jgi:hypothetical protein
MPGAEPRTKWSDAVGEPALTIPKVMNGVKVILLSPVLVTFFKRCVNAVLVRLRVARNLTCVLPGCRHARWHQRNGKERKV